MGEHTPKVSLMVCPGRYFTLLSEDRYTYDFWYQIPGLCPQKWLTGSVGQRLCCGCGGTAGWVSTLKSSPRLRRRKLTSVITIRLDIAACLLSMEVLSRNVCSSLNQVLRSERPTGQVTMCSCADVPRQNAKDASWSACGRMGFAAPKFSLLSSAPICYATNMSGKHVLQGAQNIVIRGGTFMAADTVSEAL